jgi:hypothetical protein
MYFWGGYTAWLHGCDPEKKGGIQVLGGLASSSQTVGSLLRTPWPEKPAGQIAESFINNIQSGYFFITKIMFARE